MNAPYVSLTLTRRYVTELHRSPRARSVLAGIGRPAPARTPATKPAARRGRSGAAA